MNTRRKTESETEHLEPGRRRPVQPQRVAHSRNGMVSTAHFAATRAGVAMLEAGGNAADAAAAAAFALGVCEPQASGIGGQTMVLVHNAEPRTTVALDGSTRAPNRATPESLTKKEMRRGYRATTVPSTPAVLDYLRSTYGTLPLAQILEPAIELAESGFETTELFEALSERELKNLKDGNAAEQFLKKGTRPHKPGSRLKQPALAKTLSRLAKAGADDFYSGRIARAIHADMQAHDGLLHLDDLAQVPRPIERRPVSSRFQGARVVTFPPPGAGRVLLEMLSILENFPEKHWTPDTPKGALLLAEVMRRGALDRRDRPYDPAFFPQVEDQKMLDPAYAKQASKEIRKRIRSRGTTIQSSGETTHLSVMDRWGNAVALTQSIERVFGSFVATPELGFLYNNYMSAYEYEDIGHPYYLRPNAPPWASVAPTIVFRGSKPSLVLGSPGSERIVSAMLQVLIRLRDKSAFDAVAAPRLHCSVKGKVSLESSRFRDDIPELLEKSGFEVDHRDAYSFYLGCVQLVQRQKDGLVGVADPRRDGSAGGPRT